MVKFSLQRQSHLAMLVFSALVAGSFALGVRIANDIEPAALQVVRFAIAGVTLVMLTGPARVRAVLGQGHLWRFPVLGGCLAIYFILMFEGLKITDSVTTSAVFTLTPILSGAFGWVLLRQVQSRLSWLALILGGVGALWVIFQGDWSRVMAFDVGLGVMIFAIGVGFHSLFTPLVRLLNWRDDPLPFTTATTLGALVVLILYGARDMANTDFVNLSWQVWGTVFYLAIFASAITFFLIQFATLHLNSANVMAYTYLVPIWVIVWEVALGGELPDLRIFGGIALTVLAMTVLLVTSTRASASGET